jgi:tartrate/fumarate subfamily iron-sulfur-dependent hydro-lyase beta chain
MQNGAWYNMEYHFDLPIDDKEIKKLNIGDIIYLSGDFFTARDEAHHIMIKSDKKSIKFDPGNMALFHCGPLMKKIESKWTVVSAGPTTSSRMEIFEDKFLDKFKTKVIIGKGGMGEKTKNALIKNNAIYTAYTGGAGALAAERIKEVLSVYWLEELGMPEAVWIFKVENFGPLVVAMDSKGNSIYKN